MAELVQKTNKIPSDLTLQNAIKLALTKDKPIMMDYWLDSLEKKVIIGVRVIKDTDTGADVNEKLLVKSEEEYTSPVQKIFKVGGEYIIETENSIYIIDAGVSSKRIS
jgi:hypothetical protein